MSTEKIQPEDEQPLNHEQSAQAVSQPVQHAAETPMTDVPIENLIEKPNTEKPTAKIADELTLAERAAGVAREQAAIAADALRRGELMQDAMVDSAASKDDRLIALLSYLSQVVIPFGLPILVLVSASSQKRPFQRHHAVQSIALTAIFVLIGMALLVSSVILQIVPIVGSLLGWAIFMVTLCLFPIATLMYWVAHLYYGYQAYQGKRFAIPGLTNVLRDQGWLA